ncbi:MAG: ATP-dependent DNA helicase [Chromatiales bacterium]|jgi:ATP-dependent DNA helicase DinG
MKSLGELFDRDGMLEQSIEGFRFRPQQLEMAEAVSGTLEKGGVLVCEAGTGTGKTFAYLLPALLSERKVVISTGTKNLQDQLFRRDLPRIRELAGRGIRAALLKGRSNYLCINRMHSAGFDNRASVPVIADMLEQVRAWAGKTRHGDIAELTGIPEDAAVWPLVTSTTDNCLGQECPDYEGCHLVEARRAAQEADLVVVNHHLLCADFALKDEGFGELLPSTDAFIVDEAHQLPDVANQFFGLSVSTRQLQELTRDTQIAWRQAAMKQSEIPDACDQLDRAVRDFRLLLGMSERRAAWKELQQDERQVAALDFFIERLQELASVLETAEGSDKALDSALERSRQLHAIAERIASDDDSNNVRWFETTRMGFRLSQTPLEIAEAFQKQMWHHAMAWVFTSATLAVGEDFSHFCNQLGLDAETRTEKWDSPFDYAQQALWYVPKGLVEPSHAEFVERVLEASLPVVEASGGKAFLLFTSYRALNRAAEILEEQGLDYPLLVQGRAPKNELLNSFREAGNAVLLATGSFWEGVDVQGDALSVVIIDKLPFAAPGDPLMQARLDALKARGVNPFMQYQVPQAVIALKQGAGRLIRGSDDTGVLMVCDLRLLTKPYGKTFINAMPPFARTRELDEVKAFLEHKKDAQPAGH